MIAASTSFLDIMLFLLLVGLVALNDGPDAGMIPAFAFAGLDLLPVKVFGDGTQALARGLEAQNKLDGDLFFRVCYESPMNDAVSVGGDADMSPEYLPPGSFQTAIAGAEVHAAIL